MRSYRRWGLICRTRPTHILSCCISATVAKRSWYGWCTCGQRRIPQEWHWRVCSPYSSTQDTVYVLIVINVLHLPVRVGVSSSVTRPTVRRGRGGHTGKKLVWLPHACIFACILESVMPSLTGTWYTCGSHVHYEHSVIYHDGAKKTQNWCNVIWTWHIKGVDSDVTWYLVPNVH